MAFLAVKNAFEKGGFIMNLIEKLDQQNMKAELPEMNVGDTVRVHVKIKEGSRE